jgi:localization factor PodJL
MTYRNFSPEMLNAGRTRRQIIPQNQQKQNFAPEFASRNAATSDLTRELEAIANELGRLKAGQTQTHRPAPAQQPTRAPQPTFDSNHLNSVVQSLKNDVRTQMRDDLDAQYVRLREELNGLSSVISGTSLQNSFKGEIADLMSGLETLASGNRSIQNSQDKLSDFLQQELGELQLSLHGLARNDGLNRLDDRWNSLENRWNRLEDRIDSGMSSGSNQHLSDISSRLAALQDKMSDGGLASLENRMLMLAKSVDALAHSRTSTPNAAVDFSQIDNRFDELSRAVAAIGAERATPAFDNQAVDQIEKAMSLLARKVELVANMTGQNPALDAIEARLTQLHDRFAELPDYLNHEPVMERLDRLAEKVSTMPAPSLSPASIDALTKQLSTLADEVRGNTNGRPISDGMFDRLDDRLGSIEERLQNFSLSENATTESDAVIVALEQRFAELSAHLQAMQPAPVYASTDSAEISALEQKLNEITRQLSLSPSTAGDTASFDRLENQIADLSAMLTHQPRVDDNGLAERLDNLETLLSNNQHAMLDSARKAAKQAALNMQNSGGSPDNAHIVNVIAGELANLEQLTRNTNERSTSAFEGIHGALTKIADRLSHLETKPVQTAASAMAQRLETATKNVEAPRMPAAKTPFADDEFFAPGLEADEGDLGGLNIQDEPQLRKARSPSEMAQQAANAALRNIDPHSAAAAAALQSMPGGELDDVPLSPGTAVPDLNSILKRVRDQKKAAQSQVAKDVDRKDHFLSIKRAAQAAANEVQQVEPKANAGGALGNLKTIYAKFRRPILMVATVAVIAIAALQLTSALFSTDAEPVADIPLESAAPVQNQAASGTSENQATVAALPEASSSETLVDVAKVTPEPVEPVDGNTPRIVGAEPQEPAATASASISPDTKVAPETDPATETTIAATAGEPSVPAGFGPTQLVEAANAKDMKAQFEMGRRLAENQNDPALLANAFAWFNAAAGQGFAPAQYRVGNMYEKGLGVERSATEAKLWYQMAAEAGNASAMHNLAVLFASGADGTVDSASALRWFQKAADLGVGDSQFNLGVMKGKGQGVPQDLEESYKWLAILAKSGDVEAGAKRDEVAKTMRPEQVEAAKAKIELWKPQPVVAEANDLSIPDGWKISNATTASVDVKKAVKNVQLILGKLGYKVGTPDGVMGENTRKAIRAFQTKEKIAVSGEIDGPTVKALLAKNG